MEQEQSIVHIHVADSRTSLAVGAHVGQFVVGSEGLTVVRGADTASDIEFLGDDIVPDGIDGLDVVLVACECSHISHTGIHIGSTDGVTYGLVLFDDGLVSLRVVVCDGRLAAIVEQELGKVKIALLSCGQVKTGHSHLSNLMAWYDTHLPWIRSNLLTCHVGITAGDVEELTLTRCLPIGYGTLYHVTEVIELVREVFLLYPTLVTSPVMGISGVLGACGVEIAVGFLSRADNVDYRVTVGLQLLVWIGLQDIGCTLKGLVGVGIVEGIAHAVHLEHLRGIFQMSGGIIEVLVAALTLTFRESEGDGRLTTGFESLAPEGTWSHFHTGEWHRADGITTGLLLLTACRQRDASDDQ